MRSHTGKLQKSIIKSSQNPNIIVIVIDTLRDDYASDLKDKLKKLGFVSYNNVIAPSPWTLPTHASIFTGLYPAFHKAHETKFKKSIQIKLKKNMNLLTYQLKKLGYTTYLFTANPYVHPLFGFVGFDYTYEYKYDLSILLTDEIAFLNNLKKQYSNYTKLEFAKLLFLKNKKLFFKKLLEILINNKIGKVWLLFYKKIRKWPLDKGSKYIINKAKKIFKKNTSQTKFVFINLMEVHEPYVQECPSPVIENLKSNKLNQKAVSTWREKYPEEVEYITRKIIALLNYLKKTDAYNDLLIFITSDHGQLLGEHGRIGHGIFLYDELLKVPLFIKYPRDCHLKIIPYKNKYISLLNLYNFILHFVSGYLKDDSILYSDTVFAESYGITMLIKDPLTKEEKENINKLEKYRIAIYYKSFKGVFNVADWKFEEITSYNPNIKVTENIVNHMRREVVKFLDLATKSRKIKIK